MAEPIVRQFRVWTCVGAGNHIFRETNFESTRFPDFSSRASKNSLIYCLMLNSSAVFVGLTFVTDMHTD